MSFWTADEERLMVLFSGTNFKAKDIAYLLGRTLDSIYWKARQRGLRVLLHPRWSLEEENVILSGNTPHRSYHAIRNKRRRLT